MKKIALLFLLLPAFAFGEGADLAKIDDLFAKRADVQAFKECEALLNEAAKSAPDSYDITWRLARLKVWLADNPQNSAEAKKNFGKEAWNIGLKAVKQNPNGVEGHYLTAVGIANYSQAVGILTALGEGLEGKFNEHLDAAIKTNPSFMNGAPVIAKGRYYFELPWPKRDLTKSTDWLQRAIAKNPENLRAYLYLSETLLKDGQAKKAKEMLAKAMNGPADYDPAEAARVKFLAKKTQVEIDKELK